MDILSRLSMLWIKHITENVITNYHLISVNPKPSYLKAFFSALYGQGVDKLINIHDWLDLLWSSNKKTERPFDCSDIDTGLDCQSYTLLLIV